MLKTLTVAPELKASLGFDKYKNCEKVILDTDLFLRCNDCIDNGLSCYCRNCFNPSEHINHQTVLLKQFGICRTSFDGYLYKSAQGKILFEKAQSLDQAIVDRIVITTIRTFYGFIITMIECGINKSKENWRSNLENCFGNWLEFVVKGFEDMPLIIPIFAGALIRKFWIPKNDRKKFTHDFL